MNNMDIKQGLMSFIEGKSDEEIQAKLQNAERLMTYFRCAMLEVETKLKVLNEEFRLQHERNPIANISSRLKSMDSIQGKLLRKDFPMTLDSIEENLHDVAGIRVICGFLDDIYLVAECLLAQDDIRLIARKDYIQNPKPNGYRSLHLIIEIPIFLQSEKKFIKVEVQIRTVAMESWANLEHRLRYKKDLSPELLEKVNQELLDCARTSNDIDQRMQNIRNIIEKA